MASIGDDGPPLATVKETVTGAEEPASNSAGTPDAAAPDAERSATATAVTEDDAWLSAGTGSTSVPSARAVVVRTFRPPFRYTRSAGTRATTVIVRSWPTPSGRSGQVRT